MSRIYYTSSLKIFPAAEEKNPIKIVCPCTKKECPLHDQSGGGRDWCDDGGDPNQFERCPIPKKRKARMEYERQNVKRSR